MNLSRAFFFFSLACWLTALFVDRAAGRDWVVVDVSPSVWAGNGQRWERIASFPSSNSRLEKAWKTGRAFRIGGELSAWDPSHNPPTDVGSNLGRAIAELGKKVGKADRVFFLTDGKSTDELPPSVSWVGAEVIWEELVARPGFLDMELPQAWPAEGRALIRASFVGKEEDLQDVRVEFPREGWAPHVESRRPVGNLWEWALDPGAQRNKDVSVRVSARFGHGWESKGGVIMATGHGLAAPIAAEQGEEKIRAALRRDRVALVVSKSESAWFDLPSSLCPFISSAPPAPQVVVLDCSGSMSDGKLSSALDVLEKWAEWTGKRLLVLPFSSAPFDAIDIASANGVSVLRAIAPHGPTNLSLALEKAVSLIPERGLILLVSDGLAPEPLDGWGSFKKSVLGNREVVSVPVGSTADYAVLSALGKMVKPLDLPSSTQSFAVRLRQGLEESTRTSSLPASAVPGSSLPLPDAIPGLSERPLFREAPGAEVLFRDATGAVVGAVIRIPEGVVIGLLSPVVANTREVFEATIRAAAQGGNIIRSSGFVVSEGFPFRVASPSGSGVADLLSPIPSATYAMPDPSPSSWISVQSTDLPPYSIPPNQTSEFSSSTEQWVEWLAEIGKAKERPFSQRFLLSGLFLGLVALFLRAKESTVD
mgnify:CR=1 FL=1